MSIRIEKDRERPIAVCGDDDVGGLDDRKNWSAFRKTQILSRFLTDD